MKKIMEQVAYLMVLACVTSGCKEKNPHRAVICAEIAEMKNELPMDAGNLIIQDVNVKEDLVVYDCLVDQEQNMIQADSILNSDKNYARTIASLDEKIVAGFMDADMGIKYVYKNKEGKSLGALTISAQKMKEISNKLKSGEIKPYSVLEMSQVEIDQTTYPVQIGGNLWLTDGMVKDNYVINVITLEAKAEKSDFTEEDWFQTKNNTVEGLRESPLINSCKEEIKEKDVHFSYVYKDVRDTVLTIIDIDYYDLFR